jgi:hypothetical protein
MWIAIVVAFAVIAIVAIFGKGPVAWWNLRESHEHNETGQPELLTRPLRSRRP